MPATMHYQKILTDTRAPDGVLPLHEHVAQVLNTYFSHLGGQYPENLYSLVLHEVELALLESIMRYTRNNQSQAAKMLGINRGTFRKKLAFYGML